MLAIFKLFYLADFLFKFLTKFIIKICTWILTGIKQFLLLRRFSTFCLYYQRFFILKYLIIRQVLCISTITFSFIKMFNLLRRLCIYVLYIFVSTEILFLHFFIMLAFAFVLSFFLCVCGCIFRKYLYFF